MKYCYANNMVLFSLPLHTSHKLQPSDVSIFGPLKMAYHEKVEDYIGKVLAWLKSSTLPSYTIVQGVNPISGWSKTWLWLFDLNQILKTIQESDLRANPIAIRSERQKWYSTAATVWNIWISEDLMFARGGELGILCKFRIQILANAGENAFADWTILLEILLVFEQNNEKAARKSIKATVVGSARVRSYGDIVEEQK